MTSIPESATIGMAQRINRLDWSQTSVGAMNTWPQSLKATIKTLLGSRYPMILLWGEDLIQIYNDAYTGLIGDKHPAALGRSIKVTQSESWNTIGPMIHEVMSTGVPNWVPAQMLAVNRSGYEEETYFSLSYSAVEDDGGTIKGMLCVCSEVTQQVLGERRLRLQRDLASKAGDTRSVSKACQDMAATIAEYVWEVPFALIYLKDGDHSLHLYATVGEINGHAACPQHIDLRLDTQDHWSLKRAMAGETVCREQIDRFIHVSGGPWAQPVTTALSIPIPSSLSNSPLGILVAGMSPSHALDESYRSFYELLAGQVSVALRNAQAYEEERKRAEALAEIDRAKTTFFNNVSHEFRTPLTLMLGPLEDVLTSHNALHPKDLEQLNIVYQNSLRLLKLVNTLLDFSRIEAKRVQISYQATDFSSLTCELANAFQSAIENAGLKYTVSCPSLSEDIFIDRDMWEKIVLNLLSNAFKFTFEGSIKVWTEETSNHAVFRLQDSGVGIPEVELPHLFKRFHRVRNTRSRSHEGTGIGLAFAKELVELHGGHIEVSSRPGQGTTFSVFIPKGQKHLDPDRIFNQSSDNGYIHSRTQAYVNEVNLWGRNEEGSKAYENSAAPEEASVKEHARILLVDDNADMLKYMNRILGTHWAVDTARDGLEALNIIKSAIPDIIVCDVMMPNMNGFELIAELRKDPKTTHVPVILLSARAGEEAIVEGLEKGANDYLIKPFSARELVSRVKTHLEITNVRKDNKMIKEAEAELKKFKTISDYACDAFILIREDGSFAYLNDLALKHWGYTKEEAEILRVPDIDPLFPEKQFKEVFTQAQKQGSLPPIETIHKRKDGSVFPVEVSIGSIVLDGLPHVFAVSRDITERKQAEETLKSRNEQLQRINNDLDNFIYTASHDLKAPVSNIEGLLHALRDILDSSHIDIRKDTEMLLDMIDKSINRFKGTILDLTEITKVQKEEKMDIKEIDIAQAIDDVILTIGDMVNTSKAHITVNLGGVQKLSFSKKNFKSILYNLLGNAIKYRSPHRIPQIKISAHQTDRYVVLSVADNGLGISPENLSKMFYMFKRFHDHVEGTGIGLYIVKRILENAGCKIEVESEEGVGTTFKVYFQLITEQQRL
ncbi:MAG TPA: ATP-binding protein [Cytophagales bacterium]|nr:ATP-binding protein [Cytophagales bacterium]